VHCLASTQQRHRACSAEPHGETVTDNFTDNRCGIDG